MADKRKLLGEIDRCHKKVAEGVESFKETWKKLQQASNPNQKEKYEQDLKKEIKKLQRLRDQIKTWCASNEVKDKRNLLEDRKLIETQMETFKIVERETKTKAYSKEALGLPAKIDPAEKEKYELREWLNSTIDTLNIEIDKLEADVEIIHAQNKKSKNRDKNSDKLDELEGYITKNRWHTVNLEALLRMLDNNNIDLDEVKQIKEEVEYYISDYKEPDFMENEYLYSDIVDPEILNSAMLDPRQNTGCSDIEDNDNDSNMDDNLSHISHESHNNSISNNDSNTDYPNMPTSPTTKSTASKKNSSSSHNTSSSSRTRHPTPNNTTSTNNNSSASSNASNTSSSNISLSQPPSLHKTPSTTKNTPIVISPPAFTSTPPSSTTSSLYTNHHIPNSESIRSPPTLVPTSTSISSIITDSLQQKSEDDQNQEAFVLDPILGLCPLGPIPLTQERAMQLELLESASRNLPLPSDTNRIRPLSYLNTAPESNVQIPSHHYHSYDPKHNFDTFEYFKNLVPDTLFFIFYFYEGTKAQCYAAKALKEQHWRFHKKYKMWFQRYEEPKEITNTHETGTYVYFDIEQWQQRTKEDFTFEYKFLEESNLDD